jgi:hypothetical protein
MLTRASSGSSNKRANPKRRLCISGPKRLKMNPEIPNTRTPESTMSGRLNATPATAAWTATRSSTEKYGCFNNEIVVPSTVSNGQMSAAKITCAEIRVAYTGRRQNGSCSVVIPSDPEGA